MRKEWSFAPGVVQSAGHCGRWRVPLPLVAVAGPVHAAQHRGPEPLWGGLHVRPAAAPSVQHAGADVPGAPQAAGTPAQQARRRVLVLWATDGVARWVQRRRPNSPRRLQSGLPQCHQRWRTRSGRVVLRYSQRVPSLRGRDALLRSARDGGNGAQRVQRRREEADVQSDHHHHHRIARDLQRADGLLLGHERSRCGVVLRGGPWQRVGSGRYRHHAHWSARRTRDCEHAGCDRIVRLQRLHGPIESLRRLQRGVRRQGRRRPRGHCALRGVVPDVQPLSLVIDEASHRGQRAPQRSSAIRGS